MNPVTLMKASPWFLAFFLSILLSLVSHFYLKERDAFTEFRSVVRQLGEEARIEKKRIEHERDLTLEKVRQYEKDLPAIRANAVAAYKRMRDTNPGLRPLPGASPSLTLDDGAQQECLLDTVFIYDAAEDVARLSAWQEWAELNKIPVKE